MLQVWGSQVYLEENETMSVFELFKCIAIGHLTMQTHQVTVYIRY